MLQSATDHDFKMLPAEMQQRIEAVLRTLEAQRLSCRVQMSGREMQIVVANGLSMPKYWLDRLGCNH